MVYTRGNVLVSLCARSFCMTSAGFNNSFKLAHQWHQPAILVCFKGIVQCVTVASSEAITCKVLRPQCKLALHYLKRLAFNPKNSIVAALCPSNSLSACSEEGTPKRPPLFDSFSLSFSLLLAPYQLMFTEEPLIQTSSAPNLL